MIKEIRIYTVLVILIISVTSAVTNVNTNTWLENNKSIENKPTNDLIWIDNNRIHKDSIISCSYIYDDTMDIIGCWIKAEYNGSQTFIECIDTDDYNWKEYFDSQIMAIRELTE